MIEQLAAELLSNYVGPYIKNFDKKKLSLDVMSGMQFILAKT